MASEDFISAAASGETSRLEELLTTGISVDFVGKDGATALITAAAAGHVETISALVLKGANVNHSSKGGWTALVKACAAGHVEVAKVLLANGAKPNYKHHQNGMSALMGAALNGHTAVAEELLKGGALVDARDRDGASALMKAALKGKTATAEMLLNQGSNVNNTGKDGWTALMAACTVNKSSPGLFCFVRVLPVRRGTRGGSPDRSASARTFQRPVLSSNAGKPRGYGRDAGQARRQRFEPQYQRRHGAVHGRLRDQRVQGPGRDREGGRRRRPCRPQQRALSDTKTKTKTESGTKGALLESDGVRMRRKDLEVGLRRLTY